jgi:hypothetical protein
MEVEWSIFEQVVQTCFLEPVLKRSCGRDLLLLKVMNQIGQGIRKIVVKVEIVEMVTTNPHRMWI